AAEQGMDLGSGWLFSGDIRTGWLQYEYGNPEGNPAINKGHRDSQGFYLVPKFSLVTPGWNGLSAKLTGAGATDFGINDPERESRTFVFDGGDLKSFAILQEAYVAYDSEGAVHSVRIGRSETVTPMIEADDYYMLANSFEAVSYSNRSLANVMLTGGYLHKMAGVWDSGANGTEFHSMSDASFVAAEDKERADDAGVFYLAGQYEDDSHKGQLWGYHASELYNILFAQYDYRRKIDSGFSWDLGAQFINFKEEGALADHNSTTIDYSITSARFDGSFGNGFAFATGVSKYSDGEGQGATLGAWGGFPYFANGLVFHFFEAGSLQNAASYKIQGSYDFSQTGIDNLSLTLRYTYFDLDSEYSESSTGEMQDGMNLLGTRLSYECPSGGSLAMTYEHRDLDGEPDAMALRLIGGFRF
ncbi:MAG: OprD family outer membrane porin, partial [Thermodesulfobacteriota bacterium]